MKRKKTKPPPPKARPKPDETHFEYRRGRKDFKALAALGFSVRMRNMVAAACGISRREPVPETDARYNWYLYSDGFLDARDTHDAVQQLPEKKGRKA